jgi:hypothetical protein
LFPGKKRENPLWLKQTEKRIEAGIEVTNTVMDRSQGLQGNITVIYF